MEGTQKNEDGFSVRTSRTKSYEIDHSIACWISFFLDWIKLAYAGKRSHIMRGLYAVFPAVSFCSLVDFNKLSALVEQSYVFETYGQIRTRLGEVYRIGVRLIPSSPTQFTVQSTMSSVGSESSATTSVAAPTATFHARELILRRKKAIEPYYTVGKPYPGFNSYLFTFTTTYYLFRPLTIQHPTAE